MRKSVGDLWSRLRYRLYCKLLLMVLCAAMIIDAAAAFLLYNYLPGKTEHNVSAISKNLMEETSSYLDDAIEQVYKLEIHIAWLRSLDEAMGAEGEESMDKSFQLSNELNKMAEKYPYIHSIYVYDKKRDSVITSSYLNYLSQDYFSFVERHSSFNYANYIDILSSENFFNKLPPVTLNQMGNHTTILPFVTSFPLKETARGSIVINVNSDKLIEPLMKRAHPYDAYVLALDMSGRVVTASGDTNFFEKHLHTIIQRYFMSKNNYTQFKLDDTNFHFMFGKSIEPEWLYVTVIPEDFFVSILRARFYLFLALTSGIFLLSLLVSLLVTNRLYNPVADTMNVIVSRMEPAVLRKISVPLKDEFKFITRVVTLLTDQNETFDDFLSKYRPMIEEKIIRELIYNPYDSSNMMERIILQETLPCENYLVVLVEIDDFQTLESKSTPQELNGLKHALQEAVQKFLSRDYRMKAILLSDRKIFVIINTEQSSGIIPKLKDAIHTMKASGRWQRDVTVSVGIGSLYKSMDGIGKSYEEAKIALNRKFLKGRDSVISIDEIMDNVSEYQENGTCYTFAHEKRLINLLKMGEKQECLQLLGQIIEEVVGNECIHSDIQSFFVQLTGTILRAIRQSSLDYEDIFGPKFNIYKRLSCCETREDMIDFITEQCSKVCSYINRMKEMENENPYAQLAQQMADYIMANYQQDVSLKELSDRMGYSPSYLSIVFKEHMGENFVDYINKHRISCAKEMLEETDMPINQISEKVGYHSDNSFIRIFKKYEAITPGQYREQHIRINEEKE